MKSIIIFLSIFLFEAEVQAQFDVNKPLKLSEPIQPNSPSLPVQKQFTFETPKLYSPKFPDLNAPKPRSVDLVQKNDFVNPNDLRTKKLNAPEGELQPDIKSEHFLGDFRNNGKFVKFICRDFGEVDGDRVSVYLNDVLIESDIYLEGEFKSITINLLNGFNKIDFQALNQGTSGPNTAEFRMFDDQGTLISSNQWNLTTGTKATIIVTKE